MKRITALLLALLIILSVSMPLTVHADTNWTVVDKNGFIAALKAYAKAQYNINTTFAYTAYDDPITSSIVGWSYGEFKRTAATLNLDLDDIQASIKNRVDSNGALQFLYSGSYIQYYNALIRQYLIQNGLNPDNETFNKEVYNGFLFTDKNGVSAHVFEVSNNSLISYRTEDIGDYVSAWGNTYIYDGKETYKSLTNGVYNHYVNNNVFYLKKWTETFNNADIEGVTISSNQNGSTSSGNAIYYSSYNNKSSSYNYKFLDGYVCIIYNTTTSKLYIGNYLNFLFNGENRYTINAAVEITKSTADLKNALIDIAKDGMPNLPSTEEGKNAIIEAGKYGAQIGAAIDDYIDDNDPEEPKVDPDTPEDNEPTFPEPPSGDDTLPGLSYDGKPFHFTMPDFSGFDWSISGLQEKFPFSIPFDMINFFQVLDANPETPEFRINVNIANVHFDETISLHPFDNIMSIFRNVILAGWCIFLIVATRSVFKVY